MHELSIVMSIVDIAAREAEKARAMHIEEIELDIGELSTVEMQAFEFAWQQGVKNTVLAGAAKTINRIEGFARCPECQIDFPVVQVYDACPVCNGHFNQILSGKELRVKSITVSS
jgi:hydrogenase nickel incorporation protein HypA/HybF